jgi:spore coat assembly protein SafA
MPDRELTEASVFMWSRERELVPVYDRLLVMGATTDCLSEIQELCGIHREKMADCDSLLAALGVEAPGDYSSLETGDTVESVMNLIWTKENESLDGGWLRVDPFIEDESARAILIRGSRRHSRQLLLLKEIARRCRFTLIIVVPGRPVPVPMPVPPPAPGPILGVLDYVVQPGDTMWLIAGRFGVSLDALIRANPQVRNPELIFPGEIVHIPGGAMAPGGPGPGPGGARRYVVMQGETIEIVARRFGLSVSELAAFNPQLQPPYTLTPGQVVMIPVTGAVG